MSAFNPRRHSNMFSSIANLNALPSEYELAMQHQRDTFDLESDLALFTNTQFFDFDVAEVPDSTQSFQPQDIAQSVDFSMSTCALDLIDRTKTDTETLDDFNLTDFSSFPTTVTNPLPALPQQTTATFQPLTSSTDLSRSPSESLPPHTGEKRKAAAEPSADAETPVVYLDEASRVAAEEDKRRRNTAASARFRVKKKQREQAMEKTAKEMTDRVTFLENRVAQLEMENKLLKDLITEKSGNTDESQQQQQHPPAQLSADSSRSGVRKGVGTGVKAE